MGWQGWPKRSTARIRFVGLVLPAGGPFSGCLDQMCPNFILRKLADDEAALNITAAAMGSQGGLPMSLNYLTASKTDSSLTYYGRLTQDRSIFPQVVIAKVVASNMAPASRCGHCKTTLLGKDTNGHGVPWVPSNMTSSHHEHHICSSGHSSTSFP